MSNAECPDRWAWVQLVQIPNSNISAWLELLHSVWTHGPESNRYKYLILTFLPGYHCCTVSGHIGPGPTSTNTRFRHFCPIIIVAQCPDTLVRVQMMQIPELNILSSSELLFSVWTHWPESIRFKYRIPTFLPNDNCCTVSGHIGPSTNGTNTRIKHFSILRIVVQCPDTLSRV